MTHLRLAFALLVAIAMAMAMIGHPASGLANDRSSLLPSLAIQDDDDDEDGGDNGGDGGDGDGDDDDNGNAQPMFEDDDVEFEEDGGGDGVFEDDGDDVPPVFEDDGDDVQLAPAPVVNDDIEAVSDDDGDDDGVRPVFDDDDDDDEPFGGGAVDESRRDQAIVRLDAGSDPNAFASQYGATVLRVIPPANIVLLSVNFDSNNPNALDDLFDDPSVVWGERNFSAQAPEGRPRYFFVSIDDTPQLVSEPSLPSELAYTPEASCVSGESVVVAVLDTGIDANHPALAPNILPNGVNMVDNTFDQRDVGNVLDDDGDGQIDEMVGHGTHIAGAILQVAPDASILPIKVLNSDGVGDAFFVTSGIFYAVEQGADVINLSLGSTFDSRAIQDAIDFASGEGVVIVAAVGNGNTAEPVEYPASLDSVISVAALDADSNKAEYSNFNSQVDISAPGSDVASSYPDGHFATASGTSMATSIVTGSIALVLDRQPAIGPDAVELILTSTADPLQLTDPTLADQLGAGALNVDASIACGG